MRTVLRACILAGVPVSAAGMLGTAALLTAVELPLRLYPVFAAVPLLCGCFVSGCCAGKRSRHGGIRCGIVAACCLTAMWFLFLCFRQEHLQAPVLLLPAVPAGMLGGICGVNTRPPVPHGRSHRLFAVRERAALLPLLLHRPPETEHITPD